jgi:hypothetical protein
MHFSCFEPGPQKPNWGIVLDHPVEIVKMCSLCTDNVVVSANSITIMSLDTAHPVGELCTDVSFVVKLFNGIA